MVKFLTIVLFSLFVCISFSQNKNLEFKEGVHTKKRSIKYSQLAKSWQHEQVDSAIYYAQNGYEMAEGLDYNFGMGENAAVFGDIYIVNNQLDKAEEYYVLAREHFKKSQHFFDYSQVNMMLGNICVAQDRYYDGFILYQECLDSSIKNNYQSILPHIHNNLGVLYMGIEDYDEALINYEKAHQLFTKQKDMYNIGFSLLNLSKIDAIRGNSKESIKGYFNAIHIFSERDDWVNTASAYNSIASIYFEKEDYEKAEEYTNLVLSIIEKNKSTFQGPSSLILSDIYLTVAKLKAENKETNEAIRFAKKSFQLSVINSYKENITKNAQLITALFEEEKRVDSALVYHKIYVQYNEKIIQENNAKKIVQQKMEYEHKVALEKKELEKVKTEIKNKQTKYIFITVSLASLFVSVILVLLYTNQKTKTAKAVLKKEKAELEKLQLKEDLNYKNKELTTNMMYLLEKNEFITTIANQLIQFKSDAKESNKHLIQQMINELKQNSSKEIWEEFEIRFKDVHANFYEKLQITYPNLTPNELKLCAFLKLNMSTKEISSITHQSVKSINMARYRLRKKMDIDKDENLIKLLLSL